LRLSDFDFDISIDASTNTIIKDFFIPCLSNSVRYDRAVGYFTSGWLNYAASGMVRFADNGGQARWITSPQLTESDWQALQRGDEARHDKVLLDALRQEITDLHYALERKTLDALAWMIADGILEFKLGVMRSGALFHAKFGIFTDQQGQQVSFNGSYNDSAQSNHNFESLSIFTSWREGQSPYIERDKDRFEQLWQNNDHNVRVFDLPEAARSQILEFRKDNRPYAPPSWITDETSAGIQLWQHQREALSAWESNEHKGIFRMATGSGKTITAIKAINQAPHVALITIAVPNTSLIEQWAQEIIAHGNVGDPILVYGSWRDWQDKLFNTLHSHERNGWNYPLLVIGTMQSLSGDRFNSVLDDVGIPNNSLLVVDEVHNVGAPTYQKILHEKYNRRLGLSATPERNFDEEGTAVIDKYFEKTVYTYSMQQALEDNRLSPYNYHVYFAELSDEEFEEYQTLTRRIISLRGQKNQQTTLQTNNRIDNDTQDIESLLFKRARILKNTESKVDVVNQILSSYKLNRCLIYCADNNQLDSIHEILLSHHIQHQIYTANTPKEQRQSSLDAIAYGRIPVILAIDCLDEGIDVPVVDEAIIIASSSNKRQFIQRRGRILRKAPGKTIAQLMDVIVVPPPSVGTKGKFMLRGELGGFYILPPNTPQI
jgi:superfamily II DNA or RNA helicase